MFSFDWEFLDSFKNTLKNQRGFGMVTKFISDIELQ